MLFLKSKIESWIQIMIRMMNNYHLKEKMLFFKMIPKKNFLQESKNQGQPTFYQPLETEEDLLSPIIVGIQIIYSKTTQKMKWKNPEMLKIKKLSTIQSKQSQREE